MKYIDTQKASLAMPIKATPYQHQIEAFNFVCGKFGLHGNDAISTGCSLLMEMGTGKSLTAIAITGALYNAGKIRKALIICPLSITGVWTEELSKFADFDYNAVVLRGTAEQKSKMLKQKQGEPLQVFIVNYESAWRLEKQLLAWNADLIVADESHKIKSHTTRQSKSLHKFGAKATYKMILTGTVITNKAVDVFSQYKFVNTEIFGSNFYNFVNEYCYRTGFENHTILLRKSAEQRFTEKLHSIAFRATKAECLDLPQTTEIIRYVDLEPGAMKIYVNLVKDSFAELNQGEITVTNVLTKQLHLHLSHSQKHR